MNTRLEGFAREQLSRGRGAGAVVQDLLRLGRLDAAAAREIVDRAWPVVQRGYESSKWRVLRMGLLMLAIPASLFAYVLWVRLFIPNGAGADTTMSRALSLQFYPPLLLVTLVGMGLVAYAMISLTRLKAAKVAGLGRRADPFEWR